MFNITVDGKTYEMPCSIKRTATVTPSELSGMLLDKTYFNDVIATYMEYEIALVVPLGQEEKYAELYEVLTDPVASHTFIFPYNQETLQVEGRVETVSDQYYRDVQRGTGVVRIWRGTTFVVTSNEPIKE